MYDIVLKETKVCKNRVEFDYSYPQEWNTIVIDPNERLFFEYGFDITDIPVSILNVLFVSNMLGVTMLENRTIYVEELDETFYHAIPKILDGYQSVYKDQTVSCTVICEKLVKNTYEATETKICAFTGGVDATSAVASHFDEKLLLCNIVGGDIKLNQTKRIATYRSYFETFAQRYDFGFESLKSNFRFLYDDRKISFSHSVGSDWWAAIAHALYIPCAMIVVAYKYKADKIYLASTYTVEEIETRSIASSNDIRIINQIAATSCQVEQVDSELGRSEKIKNIAMCFTPEKAGQIKLLACWNHESEVAENCSSCEKCMRTIMNIRACKADPCLFGFAVDAEKYAQIKKFVCQSPILPHAMWAEIQQEFLKDKAYWKQDKDVSWILSLAINEPEKNRKLLYSLPLRAYWKVRHILGVTRSKLFGENKNEG